MKGLNDMTAIHVTNPRHVRVVEVEASFSVERSGGAFGVGASTIGDLTLAHVRATVEGRDGRRADGWGAILLSWPWAFPGDTPDGEARDALMRALVTAYGEALVKRGEPGHPLDHYLALEPELGRIAGGVASRMGIDVPVPPLCALVSLSPVDAAIHDAYGNLHGVSSYDVLGAVHLDWDLSRVLGASFTGRYPADFLRSGPVERVPIAHTVGALDPLTSGEGDTGRIPPLTDWIARDAPCAFKVKLKGQDLDWDVWRLVAVHGLASRERGRGDDIVLYGDLNEQGPSKAYIVELLDRLERDHPAVCDALDMLEQPVRRDLTDASPDLADVSARVPIVLDEGLTSLASVDRAMALGWGGVALKTCKTQSLMLLTLPKAVEAGLHVTVQDLTNPGIALVQSVGLAARLPVTRPFETNAGQYFPNTSLPEAVVLPGVFHPEGGEVSTAEIGGTGFGYRVGEIDRALFQAAGLREGGAPQPPTER